MGVLSAGEIEPTIGSVETGIQPAGAGFEGVTGEVDEPSGDPSPERCQGRHGPGEPGSAVEAGVSKQVLAVEVGDQEKECGVHRYLRMVRSPASSEARRVTG